MGDFEELPTLTNFTRLVKQPDTDNPFHMPPFLLETVHGSLPDALEFALRSLDDLRPDFKRELLEKYCDDEPKRLQTLLGALRKLRSNVWLTKNECDALGMSHGELENLANGLRDANFSESSAPHDAPLLEDIAERLGELDRALYAETSLGALNTWVRVAERVFSPEQGRWSEGSDGPIR